MLRAVVLTLSPLALVAQVAPLSLNRVSGPDGSAVVRVKNEYSASATAYVLEMDTQPLRGPGPRRRAMDATMSPNIAMNTGKGIAPGQFLEFSVGGLGDSETWHVLAAVFADGTVAGRYELINAILASRRKAYEDIPIAIGMLTENSAATGEFDGWLEKDGSLPPVPTSVPHRVSLLLKQGKTSSEVIQILRSWRNHLAEGLPSIFVSNQ